MAPSAEMLASVMCQIGEVCQRGEEAVYPGSSFFIDPEGMTKLQLLFAFLAYGYVLCFSADMIGDGAELLLLVPEYADMVGSIVLPVLGAVPDGMMVLFSGVGELAVAQENVAVGVGALAGSTIMLLTLPWILSVYAGLVDMNEAGECVGYTKGVGKRVTVRILDPDAPAPESPKGINFGDGVSKNAILMVITSLTYFSLQGPAFKVDDQRTSAQAGKDFIPEVMKEAAAEKTYALLGTFLALFFFCGYLYLQYLAGKKEDPPPALSFLKSLLPPTPKKLESLPERLVTENGMRQTLDQLRKDFKEKGMEGLRESEGGTKVAVPYMDAAPKASKKAFDGKDLPPRIRNTFLNFYRLHRSGGAGSELHARDMFKVLRDIGLVYSAPTAEKIFRDFDTDGNGSMSKDEFLDFITRLIADDKPFPYEADWEETPKADGDENGDEDDDEDEMPEEFRDLTPEEQRAALLKESCKGMIIGTILVLIFTDPMVDVLAQIGKVTGIPAFYVSFVLAPLASNASELASSYKLAAKKTQQTITQSLQTLEGAACMNNTFCLGIFTALIYCQGLAWKFTAETISIFLVQLAVFFIVRKGTVQTMKDAYMIFALYPLSLVVVAGLEAAGLD